MGTIVSNSSFPPKLGLWEKVILRIGYFVFVICLIYLVEQFCSIHFFSWLPKWFLEKYSIFLESFFGPCIWGTYVTFTIILLILIINRLIKYRINEHKARLEDRSEVEAILVEADTVEPRIFGPEKPDNYADKKKQLKMEVDRLNEIGPDGWTEYQVLSINQLLVDFLKEGELKARAMSSLEDLQEYSEDSAHRYEEEHYDQWDTRIRQAIEIISGDDKDTIIDKDGRAEELRGELRTLLEHVADYDQYWACGSELIRNLMTCGVGAIPIFIGMGLLPILHPDGNGMLNVLNWGFLGVLGAVAAVLSNLRSLNLVEVGNTKGKKELWRAVLGAFLGFVAGVVLFAMLAGGVLAGSTFPSQEVFKGINSKSAIVELSALDMGRSIFWGIFSGFSFEWVFDRLKKTKDTVD